MSENSYKLANPRKLAPPDTYSTLEVALAAGREYWPEEAFLVQEVRPATLADFLVPANVVGDIREQMAAKIATDGPLEEAISNGAFDPEDFGAELRVFADAYAEATGLTFKGCWIIVASHEIKPVEQE